jgi:hypothetical protein
VRGLALAAGIVAAALLPGGPLGIAVPVVAALMLAAAAPRLTGPRLLLALLALALALQAALLDATWVVALDLTAAWVLASLAAGGVALDALAAPATSLRALPELTPRPSERHVPALRGAAVAVAAVVPFLLLFLSGDAAFATIAGDVPMPSAVSLPVRLALLLLVTAGALGLALTARRPPWETFERHRRSFPVLEWALPLAALNALFVAFVVVQVAVLFGGDDRVLETAGLTYAEYARSGFWQLLGASALSFAVVGLALRFAGITTRREEVLLKSLLVLFCALTCVVLASALQRLQLYEDAFGLTRLRLLVETTIFWLATMLVLAVAAVLSRRGRARVTVVAVAVTALGFLAFSLSVPDRRIADRNIERWQETGRLDVDYLSGLSADAAPELVALPERLREPATRSLRTRLSEPEPWGSTNRSRAGARDLLGLGR